MYRLPGTVGRQFDPEARVSAFFTLDSDRPPVTLDDAETQAESEPGAAAVAAGGKKRIKDLIQVFPPDAHAIVEEFDPNHVPLRLGDTPGADAEHSGFRPLLCQGMAGISDHVDYYLAKQGTGCQHGGKVFRNIDFHRDSILFQLPAEDGK